MSSGLPQSAKSVETGMSQGSEPAELERGDHQQYTAVPLTSQISADLHLDTTQQPAAGNNSHGIEWHISPISRKRNHDDVERALKDHLRIPLPREATITNDHTSENDTENPKQEIHPMSTFPIEAIRQKLKESTVKRFFKQIRNLFSPKNGPPWVPTRTRTAEFHKGELPVDGILQSVQVTLQDDDRDKVNTHLGILSQRAPAEWINSLYRHNLLYSRAKLYQLVLELRSPVSPAGSATSGKKDPGSLNRENNIRQALANYSNAMEAFKTFRKEPGEIRSDYYMMTLAGMLTELDKKRGQTKETHHSSSSDKPEQDETVQQPSNNIAALEAQIVSLLVNGAMFSSAGVRTEEESKARLDFLSRLVMALFGGAALIVPMLIMTLSPSKLNSLLTTSLFVVGVAVVLAWFMEDAGPKDILGATAAYAAVLVVFVGTG
ncbi:hypothetical protein N7493_005770 [Penicillium malachiteum]|uniref:DUF6594 domain-containing protein n=1 Tax=Penicillium malachiteum TaxID=1324776 RepID=A0AAD6MWU5_9EURO|nr:hypothetical protein N7493_005770 [Penicillium malachiteum]